METTREIILHHIHEKLGAKMMPFAGYMMPIRYSSDKKEHMAVREKAGLFDVSHMGEFLVEGDNAAAFLQHVTTNDVDKLYDGKVQYTCLLNEEGGIIDDLLVYRISEHKYMLVVNAANSDKDWKWLKSHNTFGVTLENVSLQYSLFALQGPRATDILLKLTNFPVDRMKFYTFAYGNVAGFEQVMISSTGYTGAGGYELYVPNEAAEVVWQKLMEVGASYGIIPVGLGARDTLRLEMGFCLHGNDIDQTTTPLEAGLGWITKLSTDFIGKPVVAKQKEEGISRKLIGLEMKDKGIPRQGYMVNDKEGNIVGRVTSGSLSPVLQKGIAMAYITVSHAIPGEELYVDIRGKQKLCVVKKPPFVGK